MSNKRQNTDIAKHQLASCIEYLAKIGKSEPHLCRGDQISVGRVSTVTVKTQVCYQEYSGGPNHWPQENFDAELAQVIHERFFELSSEVVRNLRKKYEDALLLEEQELSERLEQIRTIKNGQ